MDAALSSAPIRLVPFSRQEDGEEAVIGYRGKFLAIPAEALEVLDLLASGRSPGEACEEYAARHGEVPDVEGFLAALAERGFIESGEAAQRPAGAVPLEAQGHFSFIPRRWAQALFSRPVLWSSAALIGLASLAAARDPQVVPGWRALFFAEHMTAAVLLLMGLGLLTTFFHEMAHLLAAHAEGVPCRLSLGNRLWVLVAETDMTGIWALPRRRRYLPLLAGPWLDAVCAAVLILFLAAGRRGFFAPSPVGTRVLQAVLLTYLMRILWQCFFFVRTDFYYVYATACNCKDLLEDTQNLLRNLLARLLGRPPRYDQSHIPRREMRAIRFYSLFWLLGRGAAFWSLFRITLPLLLAYGLHAGTRLVHDGRSDPYAFLDALTIGALQVGFTLAGFLLWIKGLYTSRRQAQ